MNFVRMNLRGLFSCVNLSMYEINGKYATRVQDVVSYEFYDWCIFQQNTRVYIINSIYRTIHHFTCLAGHSLYVIDHFTVVCSVTLPLNGSEAGGDLVLSKISLLFVV